MSDTTIRIIILILGALLLAGIYLWHTRFSAKARRGKLRKEQREAARPEARQEQRAKPSGSNEDTPTVARTQSSPGRQVTEFDGFELIEEDVPEGFDMNAMFDPTGASGAGGYEDAAIEMAAMPDMPYEDELIVSLYVTAQGDSEFAGNDIVAAFKRADMVLGEHDVFHHHGVGRIHSEQPLFTAANMYEPGTFDTAAMDRFKTRGIALFMRLPQPLDGALVFEMLLHSAQRLAESLHGHLLDSRHRPLEDGEIERLREQVAQFGFEAI
jgi:cell division protein ZipA